MPAGPGDATEEVVPDPTAPALPGAETAGETLCQMVTALTVRDPERACCSPCQAPAKRARITLPPEAAVPGGSITSGLRSWVSQAPAPSEEVLLRLNPGAESPTASLVTAMAALAGPTAGAPPRQCSPSQGVLREGLQRKSPLLHPPPLRWMRGRQRRRPRARSHLIFRERGSRNLCPRTSRTSSPSWWMR